MMTHVMEMLKVVEDPIQYLDSLNIPYSVRKVESFVPQASDLFYILIEHKDTTYFVRYYMIDGKWSYVY